MILSSSIQGTKGEVLCESKLTWWFSYYEMGITFFSNLLDCEVDEEKVARVVEKAIRFRFSVDGFTSGWKPKKFWVEMFKDDPPTE